MEKDVFKSLEPIRGWLKTALEKKSLDELAKAMGYTQTEKFSQRLDKVLCDPQLGLGGGYDFKLTSREFLSQLLNVLEYPNLEQFPSIIAAYEKEKREKRPVLTSVLARFEGCMPRLGSYTVALGFYHRFLKKYYRPANCSSPAQLLDEIKTWAKENYVQNHGETKGIDGKTHKIIGYEVTFYDGETLFISLEDLDILKHRIEGGEYE